MTNTNSARAFVLETKSAAAANDNDPAAEVKTALDTLTSEVKAKAETEKKLVERLDGIEAKLNRGSDVDADEYKSAGELLVESDGFKALVDSRAKGRAHIDLKAITSANASVGAGRSAGTSLAPAMRVAGIVAPPQRSMTLRDLIAPGSTDAASIEYVKQTGFTNAAATVAEGAAKPYSDLTFDLVSAPVRTLAHLFKASKQIMEDSPALSSQIDVMGRYGLKTVEENQLLNGSGTGQNIAGIVPQASAFAPAFVPQDATYIDRIRLAMLQVRLAEYEADGIILHPSDWAAIDLTKDNEGRYIVSNPSINNGKNLWGIPVVETTAMAAGTFLTGAFGIAAQVFDRWQARVEISSENADDWEKNLLTVRVEERIALAVYRPEAFVVGTLASA
ncbi:phage major capsid protein [Rhizobium sp. CFBP 13726]|uniref:phage major capsid protein n=1 Tax=Rhizobium sp. CFBP 13726 TaxID=2775296 RepID=UPI00177D90AE|nr:phage major capsid protein [Rhizobium sp. CFBP 13726]MBD8650808.1 phage major capsid protein [Rhizobium sp. CFBP 13726]